MRNPTGKKLEKIIFKLFDDASQGVDRYNHNDSLWLIFTNEMRWVVEYTKDQTLWYNYSVFKDEMALIGLNCVEDKDLIQKWFESRFLNINPVEDTIQNGVKEIRRTRYLKRYCTIDVEDTIQNGVRHTRPEIIKDIHRVEDTIQNGVKEPKSLSGNREGRISNTIENGVKNIKDSIFSKTDIIKNTIQDGVKHVEDGDWLDGDERFNNIIQNGVKNLGAVDYDNLKHVEGIIENGVKETYDDCSNNIARVEGIIRIGEKIS